MVTSSLTSSNRKPSPAGGTSAGLSHPKLAEKHRPSPRFQGCHVLTESQAFDAQLQRQLEDALHNSNLFPLDEIEVNVSRGHVVLRGCVRTWHLKQMAQQLSMQFTDAPRLHNRIEVRQSEQTGNQSRTRSE